MQWTGRTVDLSQDAWLDGPVRRPTGIGKVYFDELAQEKGLDLHRNSTGSGLIADFDLLVSPTFDPSGVHPAVADFYEHTSTYDLDAWGVWCGFFRPFGSLLAFLFSRRLQQLNVPLSSQDTSRGITSDIVQLVDKNTNEVHTIPPGSDR